MQSGVLYTLEKKTETPLIYLEMIEEGITVSDRALAKVARVGETFEPELGDLSWSHGILLINFPMPCPELNPIEFVNH